jgi:hypothetical protein
MSAGTLSAKVVLDHPQQIYYGSSQPITGHLTSHCTSDQEIFGPFVINIHLHGRAKTKVYKSSGHTRTLHRGRAPICSVSVVIHDGPLRIGPKENANIPFSIGFPTRTQQLPSQSLWDHDMRFAGENSPLPPTFEISYDGFARRFDAFVEYRVDASIETKGLDVKIQGLAADTGPVILYEQPRSVAARRPTPAVFKTHVLLQNQHLLPGDQQPSGFKQKAKARLSSSHFPEYHFDVITSCPQHIFVGEPLVFEVAIRETKCTAPVRPEITLDQFQAGIVAHTEARAERQTFASAEIECTEILIELAGKAAEPETPFSKANDYTKIVKTREVPAIVTSSFSTYNIRRRYTLTVKFNILGAQKCTRIEERCSVIAHPPSVGAGSGNAQAVAGPSTARVDEAGAVLPEYEHLPDAVVDGFPNAAAGPSTARREERIAPLPEYEWPPEYHDGSAAGSDFGHIEKAGASVSEAC